MTESLFEEPVKQINDSNTSIKHFQVSKAYKRLLKYSNKYIKIFKTTNINNVPISELDQKVIITFDDLLFKKLDEILKLFPPISKEVVQQRFGNTAIRSFHDHLNNDEVIDNILVNFILHLHELTSTDVQDPNFLKESIIEIKHYLMNAFGNRDRMDYGTGHELSFLAFLMCLDILKVITYSIHTLTFIFDRYYKFVENIILSYNLEPAGSHGVWGLDDNFHFSYILGSAQMMVNTTCSPKEVIPFVKNDFVGGNFLLWNVNLIKKVKGLKNVKEHSPVLNDILMNIKTWDKINMGLYKMWIDEVLLKFPVVQHFYFGKYFFSWKVTKKIKNDIIQKRLFSETESQEEKKGMLLKYRMNQITVDNVINKVDGGGDNKRNGDRRLFPMNPPKRKTMYNNK